MKRIIFIILNIFILFIIVDRSCTFVLDKISEHVYAGQGVGKVNHFLKIKNEKELIIFGSSRANHHIDNIKLDSSSFNAGIDGKKIGFIAGLISCLSNKTNIIVHIDPEEMSNPNYVGEDCKSLNSLYKRNADVRKFIDFNFPSESWILRVVNSYGYNGKVWSIFKNSIRPKYDYTKYTGFDPLVPTQSQKNIFNNMMEKRLDHGQSMKSDSIYYVINQYSNSYIDQILSKAKEYQINITFITSPIIGKQNKKLAEFIQEYFASKQVKYLNYSGLYNDLSIYKDYWKDLSHLSKFGAEDFTEKLRSDLNFIN